MANLPASRVNIDEAPFAHVGVDFFDLLLVKQLRCQTNRYGCLFTCLTTRAIHLEVAANLSKLSFINAMRRFVARRGPLKHIFSHNRTNLVGCNRTLRCAVADRNQHQIYNCFRQQSIEWSFNHPGAIHLSGCLERRICTVKNILIAVVSKQTMNDDMLHTLFLKVEDIITSRPLCDVTLEPGSTTSLTPNHLLKIEPSVGLPPILCIQSDCFARQCHHVVQYAADQFWNRWVYGMLDHPN